MAVDLTWVLVSTNTTIYDPEQIVTASTKADGAVETTVRITNVGEDTLDSPGIYIRPASTLGAPDYPSAAPHTDYLEMVTLGTKGKAAVDASSDFFNDHEGLYYEYTDPNTSASVSGTFRRNAGDRLSTKLTFPALLADQSVDVTFVFRSETSLTMRLFVDVVVA